MEEDLYNQNLRKIKLLIKEIYEQRKKENSFIAGKNKVHYSGPLFDEREVNAVISNLTSSNWMAEGKSALEFEKLFSEFIGGEDTIVVNSGSSALLLIFSSLMVKDIDNPLKEGDEVITSALTFPTTLNSIILNKLKPVFVDVELGTYNIDPEEIEKAISEKTKAILVTHHLGNPCEMNKIMKISKKHNLYVIEDCCDAHGATFEGKKVGGFGIMSAFSFYGAHAMTMGEGGAIVVNDEKFSPILRSLKTCGRACTCSFCRVSVDPDFQCPQRFSSKYENFENFDKRTLYPYIGYKFKILDLQCAFGIEQLKKISFFVERRQENFDLLIKGLEKFERYLILPRTLKEARASWFSVPLTLKPNCNFRREDLVSYLEKNNIETRPLLGGNLKKQPAYQDIEVRALKLDNTDYCHENSFYIGCYPGINQEMINAMIKVFEDFFRSIDKNLEMKKIFITGGTGTVGRDVSNFLKEKYDIVVGTRDINSKINGYREVYLDITNKEGTINTIINENPDYVLHLAALTDVNLCEENKELARKVNVEGTRNIVSACEKVGARLIYASTNYVFDGKKGRYSEEDIPNPINFYSLTKLEGEKEVLKYPNSVVTRICPFGLGTKDNPSFTTKIIQELSNKQSMNLFTDQFFSPIFTYNYAEAIVKILNSEFTGIINIAGAERLSRYEFARNIAFIFSLDFSLLKPIKIGDLKENAERPRDTSLDISKAKTLFGDIFLDSLEGLKLMKKIMEKEREED